MPSMSRRQGLLTLGSLALLPASAQASPSYPERTVRIVVNSNAGVSTDAIARAAAVHLQGAWKQPVVVENKPGASGTIGAAEVVRSKPDGHTMLVGVTSLQQTEFLMPRLSYRFSADLMPVVMICKGANALVVPSQSPYQSLNQWVDAVRKSPGRHSYGTYGTGTTAHIWGETFRRLARLDLTHVPFKGSALMMQDVLGGQIEAAWPDLASAMPMVQAGKLRVLAVTGTARHPALPNTPTFRELGYEGLDPYGWYGVMVPRETPPAVVKQISQGWLEAIQDPKLKKLLDDLGLITVGAGPAEFQRILAQDRPIWERAIREGNIQLDG